MEASCFEMGINDRVMSVTEIISSKTLWGGRLQFSSALEPTEINSRWGEDLNTKHSVKAGGGERRAFYFLGPGCEARRAGSKREADRLSSKRMAVHVSNRGGLGRWDSVRSPPT